MKRERIEREGGGVKVGKERESRNLLLLEIALGLSPLLAPPPLPLPPDPVTIVYC